MTTFENEYPTIVDCDVLEAAKENVQPLGTGRKVSALSAILTTPHGQREAKLADTRNRLRINVELAMEDEEDGDLLEAYCRLVYWTVDNYPHGHSVESGLLELLEEATRVLKDDRGGKWRNELKYLKLWLLYASYVEQPTIIYKFMIANDIGTTHALFYEEYAAVLERDGRRKAADQAYALGIARRASPLEHLEARYEDFQKRMISKMFLPPAPTPVSTQVPRAALATTSLAVPATSFSQPSNSSRTLGAPAPASSSRLQIFVDPSGSESQAGEAESNTWQELGGRKTRIKENLPTVKKMAGTTIKQAGRGKRIASGPSASKISVYRDEDAGAAEMSPPSVPDPKKSKVVAPETPAKGGFAIFVDEDNSSNAPASGGVLSTPRFTPFRDEPTTASAASPRVANATKLVITVKQEGTRNSAPASEAEALRKDPLKNYGGAETIELDADIDEDD